MRSRPSPFKLALAVAALGAGLLLVNHYYGVRTQMDQAVTWCREAGPFAFFAAMALLPAVAFPLAAFTLVAGPVFGPSLGVSTVIACSIAAVTVNVALSYWLATRALRPLVTRLVRWLGYALPEIRPHAAWTVVLIVRIVPGPPFFLQSYLLGLARAPFQIYMIVSVIVPSAYLAGTIVFMDGMVRGDRWAMAGAVAIFVMAGAVLHFLRKRLRPTTPATSARVTDRSPP